MRRTWSCPTPTGPTRARGAVDFGDVVPIGRSTADCTVWSDELLVLAVDAVELWFASSLACVCLAVARVDFAELTFCTSAVVSNVATVWPPATLSPIATRTASTVPAIGKDTVDVATVPSVPTDARVWVTEPGPAVATR